MSDNSVDSENIVSDKNEYFNYCEHSYRNHSALCDITEKTLDDILSSDHFLNDIPYDITNEEVQSQIAIVKGQSITIYIKRDYYSKFKIVIPEKNTTVLELKKAIKHNYELMQKRSANRHRKKLLAQRRISSSTSSAAEARSSESGARFTEKIPSISWRYIWRTYYLEFDGNILDDDAKLLSFYGIRNKSSLKFVKKAKIIKKLKRQKRNK